MPLTLRRLHIGPAVYAHLADYQVLEDGSVIGRIEEEGQDRAINRPEQAWSWSLTIVDSKMAGIKTSGYGRDLDEVVDLEVIARGVAETRAQAQSEAIDAEHRHFRALTLPPEWSSRSGEAGNATETCPP
jgi:hypothetical protein